MGNLNINEEITQFLAKRENIDMVCDIHERWSSVQRMLEKLFWEKLVENLNLKIKTDKVSGWRIEGPSKPHENYAKLNIKQGDVVHGDKYLSFTVEQESMGANHALYYGLNWNQEVDELPVWLDNSPLVEKLPNDGKRTVWWLFWLYIAGENRHEYQLTHRDALKRMSEDMNKFVEEVANPFWAFFTTYREKVENAHHASAPIDA